MAPIWSGVGMPVNAVNAKPPAFFATFSQSMRLKTSFTAPAALVSAGRFSTRPVTMPSISAILASSKPWKRQPLNLRHRTSSLPENPASIISSTLDLPAPQSPWTPIVTGLIRPLTQQSDDRRRDRFVVQQIDLGFVVSQDHSSPLFSSGITPPLSFFGLNSTAVPSPTQRRSRSSSKLFS